jgi:hypothetical protein
MNYISLVFAFPLGKTSRVSEIAARADEVISPGGYRHLKFLAICEEIAGRAAPVQKTFIGKEAYGVSRAGKIYCL